MVINLKIFKNWHYSISLQNIQHPLIILKNKTILRQYCFTESCIYKFNDADQLDTNKLFGFSIGLHHVNSFRFGWRAIPDENKIEIIAYEYRNGIRSITPITKVNINSPAFYKIAYDIKTGECEYVVYGNQISTVKTNGKLSKLLGLGYTLGFYFGGNKKAPHKIILHRCS